MGAPAWVELKGLRATVWIGLHFDNDPSLLTAGEHDRHGLARIELDQRWIATVVMCDRLPATILLQSNHDSKYLG